jgi:hypothetical protein
LRIVIQDAGYRLEDLASLINYIFQAYFFNQDPFENVSNLPEDHAKLVGAPGTAVPRRALLTGCIHKMTEFFEYVHYQADRTGAVNE